MTHRESIERAKEKVLEAAKLWRVSGVTAAGIASFARSLGLSVDEWQRLESEGCERCNGDGYIVLRDLRLGETEPAPCPAGCIGGRKA